MTAVAVAPTVDTEQSAPLWRALVSTVFTTVGTLFALAVIAGVIGSAGGWYRLDVVLSGSMTPTYQPGDLVYAESVPANRLDTGDVIMFQTPEAYGSETVTHRVVAVEMSKDGVVTVRTKGDANDTVDPWNAQITTAEVWVVKKDIPKVGFVAQWAKTWWPLLIAIAVSLPMLGFARRRVREAYAVSATVPASKQQDGEVQ